MTQFQTKLISAHGKELFAACGVVVLLSLASRPVLFVLRVQSISGGGSPGQCVARTLEIRWGTCS